MTKNLILIGASYLLDGANALEVKSEIWDAVLLAGALPIESGGGFLPYQSDLAKNAYRRSLSANLDRCACYIFCIPQELASLQFSDADEEFRYLTTSLQEEIKQVNESGKPVFIFSPKNSKNLVSQILDGLSQTRHYDNYSTSGELKRLLRNRLTDFIEPTAIASEDKFILPKNDDFQGKSVFLQAFYYSPIELKTKSYWIEIFYEKTVLVHGSEAFCAREHGFHDLHPVRNYIGYAYIQSSGYLRFDLKGGKDILSILVNVGNLLINEIPLGENVYFGSIQGLTSYQPTNGFCYKTVLAWVGETKTSTAPETIAQISRFLSIRKKGFLSETPMMSIKDVLTLKIDGFKNIDFASHIAGVYRVWTIGTKDGGHGVTQSKMVINPDYTCTIENPLFPGQQFCEIFLSSDVDRLGLRPKVFFIMRERVLMTHQQRGGVGQITSIAIADVPMLGKGEGKLEIGHKFAGAFSSIGTGQDSKQRRDKDKVPQSKQRQGKVAFKELRAGYFVALLEESEDVFQKDFLSKEQIIRKQKEDPRLWIMYRYLLEENKRLDSSGGENKRESSLKKP